MKNIGIIGSGSFGCALANVLIKNHNVKIWSFKKEESDIINNEHRCMFIDNSKLDERIVCYTNYEDVIEDSEYLILVTPSSVIRNTCKKIKEYVTNQKIIIASKGMEIETNKFLTDVVKEEFVDEEVIPVKQEESDMGTYIIIALAVLGALGAGYYLKVVKKKEKEEVEALENDDDDDNFFSEVDENEFDSENSEEETEDNEE